jgi:hypothetical protein
MVITAAARVITLQLFATASRGTRQVKESYHESHQYDPISYLTHSHKVKQRKQFSRILGDSHWI